MICGPIIEILGSRKVLIVTETQINLGNIVFGRFTGILPHIYEFECFMLPLTQIINTNHQYIISWARLPFSSKIIFIPFDKDQV
jgi:hypothetical protein